MFEDRLTILDFHWLVARADEGVEFFTDEHRLWMYTIDELISAFDAGGFQSRWEDDGLMPGRGLIIATRPVVTN